MFNNEYFFLNHVSRNTATNNTTTPTIITGATTGVKAKVIGYADATSTDQPTLFLEYIGAGTDNVTIRFSNSENLSANTGITHTTVYAAGTDAVPVYSATTFTATSTDNTTAAGAAAVTGTSANISAGVIMFVECL